MFDAESRNGRDFVAQACSASCYVTPKRNTERLVTGNTLVASFSSRLVDCSTKSSLVAPELEKYPGTKDALSLQLRPRPLLQLGAVSLDELPRFTSCSFACSSSVSGFGEFYSPAASSMLGVRRRAGFITGPCAHVARVTCKNVRNIRNIV